MITSKHPSINEYNRVISSVRPLGSTFKIIPYTAALIEGIKLSDKFEDLPISVSYTHLTLPTNACV